MYMNIRVKKEGLDLKQLTEDLGEEYTNNNSDDAYNQMSDDRDENKKNNKNGVIV